MSTEPLRILELRSVRGIGGGPEKTILFGAVRMNPARHAVTVCYVRDQRDRIFRIDQRARALGVDYTEIHERHSIDPAVWPRLRRLVRERRIEIVHAHDYKTDLLAFALARVEGIIPVATAHGWSGDSWRERRVYYPADRRVLAAYPRVIAVSTTVRDRLILAGVAASRIVVVPNGIDHQAFRPRPELREAVRRELGLEPQVVALGAVGRLETEKNFPLLLRAFRKLLTGCREARLVIAGEGRLRAPLERMAADLGLETRCRFVGHVEDVARFHQALDLFVQSSDTEGTPNAVLEAMACGTPVVATDAGGTSEVARHGREALIVPVGDEQALVAALQTVLVDNGRREVRAAAARRRVETELSFSARLDRLARIYDELRPVSRAAADRPAVGMVPCA
jgi:glycosyltransferase involved in cell wall biosynthesis